MSAQPEMLDMAGETTPVEVFTEQAIANALNRIGFRYLQGAEGNFLVRLGDEHGPTIDVFLGFEEEHFYVIRALSSRKPVLTNVHDVTLEVVNAWNRDYRLPKAYLESVGEDINGTEHVVLEAQHVVISPMTPDHLSEMTVGTIHAAQEFFRGLHTNGEDKA